MATTQTTSSGDSSAISTSIRSTRSTRATRKRDLEQEAAANAPKKAKNVKWEWLGDGGKWNRYTDQNNEELIKAFAAGKKECIVGVAPGVKMKARFDAMTQTNMSTGWQRDLRCISSDANYTTPIWEMEKDSTSWTIFPDIPSKQLEAGYLCGNEEIEVNVAMKSCKINLHSNEMTNETGQTLSKIRRRNCLSSNVIWEWKDEHGSWNPYSTDHCELLEDGYNVGHDYADFTISGRSYQLDLKKMVQMNLSTKVNREIRRRDTQGEVDNEEVELKTESSVTKPRKRSRTDTDTNKVIKNAKTKSVHSDKTDQSDSTSTATTASTVKSQVFSGKCPVDTECQTKLGKAQVYCEGSIVWNCTLNQTNIKNNNNKFYIIQLLEDIGSKNSYSIWFRWGRVGKTGQSQLQSFGSNLDSAKSTFTKKFNDKTNNTWDGTVKNFVKIPGKYDLVEVDYEAEDETDAADEEMEDGGEAPAKPESKLPPQLQSLIELICNVQAMEDAVKEMKYDTKKAPLGKLTSSQIKQGYSALKKIESLISSNKPDNSKIIRACDEFYTRIPHDFGMRTPPVIKTKEQVKEKLALLETLGDIQIALKVIQGGDKTISEHPVDRHYKELHCQLDPLDKHSDTMKMVEKYIYQTHGKTHTDYSLSVIDAFEMNREGEEAGFKDMGNRQLLWHGSRLTNWVGIINSGLRIAPPEAPVTGYMFGKGVYFADIASKSANYCFASSSKDEGLCILCEVSLGKPNELLAADYNADNLPAGTHSVKALGRMSPDPTHNHTLENGCVVPMGPTHDTGVRNPKGYTLNYNEYIVYDTSQIKMKYLVRLKFNFK